MANAAEGTASGGSGPGDGADLRAFIESIVERDLSAEEETDVVERLLGETRWLREYGARDENDADYNKSLLLIIDWTVQILKERRPDVLRPTLTQRDLFRPTRWLIDNGNAFVTQLPEIVARLRANPKSRRLRARNPEGARRLFEQLMLDPNGAAVDSTTVREALAMPKAHYLSDFITKPGVPYQRDLLWALERGGPPNRPTMLWRPSVVRFLALKRIGELTPHDRRRLRLLPDAPPAGPMRQRKA